MPKNLSILPALALAALICLFSGEEAIAQKRIEIYTAQTATTAQLPLMAAIKAGWPGEGCEVAINYWKNLDDLRALVLAGKGDIWVGHVEALARAAGRGAPVALAEITAWRKFFLVSVPLAFEDGREPRHPETAAELLDFAAKNGLRIGSSPPNSPMTAFLSRLGNEALIIDSLPPQQLILELSSGKRQAGMLPEPQASVAALKAPGVKVIGSLETEYARRFGGEGWQPQAAVAVNLAFLKESPELVDSLISLMGPLTSELAAKGPREAAKALSSETIEAIGEEALVLSLEREIIRAAPASEVKEEVLAFIKAAAPELYQPGASPPPESFFLPGAGN